MAVEEPQYRIEREYGTFEIRVYSPTIVADTVVTGAFGDGTNEGFRRLAGYIFGANGGGRKIAMTTPVGAVKSTDGWTVTFTMPSSFTMASLPVPDDVRVRLREVPARRVAAVRFSGTWGAERFEDLARKLVSDAKAAGLAPSGAPPVFARYNPPWTPWFLRRNEVLVPIEGR